MASRAEIRVWVLIHGRPQRSAAKHLGVSRDTVTPLLRKSAEAEPHENALLLGPSNVGKTHRLRIGRAACLHGYRVLFRAAGTLASERALAQLELPFSTLLAHLQRFHLILVEEVGSLPFAQPATELLFPFFADRFERARAGFTSNVDFASWTEGFGHEWIPAALLDRLVHRSTILLLESGSYRFRQSMPR